MRLKIPADPGRVVESTPGNSLNSINLNNQLVAERASRTAFSNDPPAIDWDRQVQPIARDYCRSLGYTRAVNAATVPFAHDVDSSQGWRYTEDLDPRANYWTFAAYQIREWTATCQKTKRRRR